MLYNNIGQCIFERDSEIDNIQLSLNSITDFISKQDNKRFKRFLKLPFLLF